MQPSEFKNSILFDSYDENTAENYRNCYVSEKRIVNYQKYQPQILVAQIKELNEDCVKNLRPYFLYFPRNKAAKSFMVEPSRVWPGRACLGQFIVSNI